MNQSRSTSSYQPTTIDRNSPSKQLCYERPYGAKASPLRGDGSIANSNDPHKVTEAELAEFQHQLKLARISRAHLAARLRANEQGGRA